jgi:hypothetical protein
LLLAVSCRLCEYEKRRAKKTKNKRGHEFSVFSFQFSVHVK